MASIGSERLFTAWKSFLEVIFRGVCDMGHEDLDTELAEALDLVDEAQKQVDIRRNELWAARETLSQEKARVREINGEIRARVRTGKSTRPLFDAKATFEEGAAEPTTPKKSRKREQIGASIQ